MLSVTLRMELAGILASAFSPLTRKTTEVSAGTVTVALAVLPNHPLEPRLYILTVTCKGDEKDNNNPFRAKPPDFYPPFNCTKHTVLCGIVYFLQEKIQSDVKFVLTIVHGPCNLVRGAFFFWVRACVWSFWRGLQGVIRFDTPSKLRTMAGPARFRRASNWSISISNRMSGRVVLFVRIYRR